MRKKNLIVNMSVIFFASLFFMFSFYLSIFISGEALAKDIMVKAALTVDQTGPVSFQGKAMENTWRWYAEYINEERGGWKDLKGNTVKLKVLCGDTGLKAARTVSLYKKFKGEGALSVFQVTSIEVAAIRSLALRDKMPLPTNSGALVYPLPSPCFGHWADYSACSASMIDYVKEKWEKSDAPWTKKRAPRVAFIGPEGYPSWSASISPEVMRYAKLKGVDVVGKFFIKLRPIDTKPQVLAAKKAGADFIYTGILFSQGGAVVRDLYELGLRGESTKEKEKIEIIGMFPMVPIDMIKLMGGRLEPVKGMRTIGSFAYVGEDLPSMNLLRKYAKKYNELDTLGLAYTCGWFGAIRTAEAIRLALQKVPGDKLTRGDVWDAFLRIKDFDTGGIVASKVTFTEEDRIGMKKVRVDEIINKKGARRKIAYTDYKMLHPIYTEKYARAHGKKSIYSEESLKLLKMKVEDVGYKRIKQ